MTNFNKTPQDQIHENLFSNSQTVNRHMVELIGHIFATLKTHPKEHSFKRNLPYDTLLTTDFLL
jgi:hypothetical protein